MASRSLGMFGGPEVEILVQEKVREVVEAAHRIIFMDDTLTTKQARWVWHLAIASLIQTTCFDLQTEVMKEGLETQLRSERNVPEGKTPNQSD